MFSPLIVILIILGYMGLLFLIGLWVEHRAQTGVNFANNPIIYALTLSIYCTAWTFYGSVGNAATSGFLFTPIYLGPTIAIVLWWILLRRLVRLKNSYNFTSIADFISTRYGKSQSIAAIVTSIALVGIVPYIALQLKAVTSTFHILTSGSSSPPSHYLSFRNDTVDVGLIVAGLMVFFTIMFGARRLNPTERHQGIVIVLAIESLVKLVAFLAAGLFVTYGLYSGLGDILQRLAEQAERNMAVVPETSYISWVTYTILSMSAILFLPRMFHVAVIENFDEKHIRTAMWLFPLYMFLLTFFVFPIAMGGLLLGYSETQADSFTLLLPLDAGQTFLALLVFIGGFSAATSMIMVSSMTIATMVSNHLILPFFTGVLDLQIVRRYLLQCRWAVVAGIILIGYLFQWQVGEAYMLMNMGLIAFAAVIQFAPAILGGLFWQRGTACGATLGLVAGFVTWGYTLLLPSFVKSGWFPLSILEYGPWGLVFLRPEQLFGLVGLDNLSHAVLWSLLLNTSGYVLGSLLTTHSETDQAIARDFVNILKHSRPSASNQHHTEAFIDSATKKGVMTQVFSQYFPPDRAAQMTTQCFQAVGIADKAELSIIELTALHNHMERLLAGSIGAAAAHVTVRRGMPFSEREAQELSQVYAGILAELHLTPEELQQQVDHYQERAAFLTRQAEQLEQQVRQRTEEKLREAHLAAEATRQTEYQAAVIAAQRDFIRELSTPLMPLADGVLAMPLIGTIDTSRAQQIMEALLEEVTVQRARVVILDITGVRVVDTQVAQALIQTTRAASLLGTQVVLTGIQPEIAQTLVQLGIDLGHIVTRSTLQDGIAYALNGYTNDTIRTT